MADENTGIDKGLLASLLFKGISALAEQIIQLVINAGKEDAEKLRNGPITISIAYGGGDGEAQEALANIELKLDE